MHWEPLFTQPLVLAVPAEHPLAERSDASLVEVAEDDFVMLRRTWDLRTLTDGLCQGAGFSPRVAFESDDLSVALGLVNAGLGVAVVPAADLQGTPTSMNEEPRLRLTDPGAHREVGLAWSNERRLLPSAEMFRQHVLEATRTQLGEVTRARRPAEWMHG